LLGFTTSIKEINPVILPKSC